MQLYNKRRTNAQEALEHDMESLIKMFAESLSSWKKEDICQNRWVYRSSVRTGDAEEEHNELAKGIKCNIFAAAAGLQETLRCPLEMLSQFIY